MSAVAVTRTTLQVPNTGATFPELRIKCLERGATNGGLVRGHQSRELSTLASKIIRVGDANE